ncbi:E3 ubiquitin-protein ligase RNF213-like [Saccostrea cucullata]|uniref:E3 ubiquitin-protein ligase RNF213-like n=1 Tax=Saccostrea cuccullata TaxID=36930 RepID=UPI002ED09F5F
MRHGSKEMKCPMSKCGKVIPSNFNENEHAGIKRENMKKFTSYQESCNTFYMKVVSQLCFENNSPPEKEVIKKLSSLITSECVPEEERVATLGRSEYTKKKTLATKRMCIFDTTTDITPVFRSFLLQLLIRTNSSDVYEHLAEFFKNASQCVQNEEGQFA